MSSQDSRQISDVKVLLRMGTDGVGISTIEKTGTSGLVDTYTITLSDGRKITYTVTNGADGNGIVSIEKTSTTGLVDTYTITFTDGTTTTFDVTNGKYATDIVAIENVYGSKNLLPFPYKETSKVEGGITFTVNDDGSVSVSGTCNSPVTGYVEFKCIEDGFIGAGEYKITGCPSNGSLSSYYLIVKADGSWGSAPDYNSDTGNGLNLIVATSITDVRIRVAHGTVISTPIVFYPMVRDARITDDTFVPWAMTNKSLTNAVKEINEKLNYYLDDVSNGSTGHYSLATNTRALLFFYGAGGTFMSMIWTNWQNAVSSVANIGTSTGFTVTASSGQMSISNSSGYGVTVWALIFTGSITKTS